MLDKPFRPECFLGYVNEVSPQKVSIHFPSANLLQRFRRNGQVFSGGNVGEFVLIEGERYGFLAKTFNLKLPDSERKELSEKAVSEETSIFHPIAEAELLLSFSVSNPAHAEKTISRFPEIGAKVYASSKEYVSNFVERFGVGKDNKAFVELGRLASDGTKCELSLDALLGRHCAVVGTTGSGKSWTTAKVIESVLNETKNKLILVDPTGEYSPLDKCSGCRHVTMGTDGYFSYKNLRMSDLMCLLRPTGQMQRPILLEAIRSLKTVRVAEACGDTSFANLRKDGLLLKAGQIKANVRHFQARHQVQIDDRRCDFDIRMLWHQIKEECVKAGDATKWGVFDNWSWECQSSLIFRINELTHSHEFDALFNFSGENAAGNDIISQFDVFNRNVRAQLLRLDFSGTSSSFNAREILANSIARYLYDSSKEGKFKKKPLVFVLDEAHLFLNKNLIEADQSLAPLDAVDLIAKECRKFGLFLCLTTQMPRDIPVGTLSQMGAFIVHRLINEQDRRTVEMACSVATKSALSYLPALGAGETIVMGVEFPMPIPLRISEPAIRPRSDTPKLIATVSCK